jgi:ribosomal protein L19
MDLIKALSEQYMKPELPPMKVGDTVRVTIRVKEGNRERNQAFEGTLIAKKHGGINETITVRRISDNVGCEKVFPVPFAEHRLGRNHPARQGQAGETLLPQRPRRQESERSRTYIARHRAKLKKRGYAPFF